MGPISSGSGLWQDNEKLPRRVTLGQTGSDMRIYDYSRLSIPVERIENSDYTAYLTRADKTV